MRERGRGERERKRLTEWRPPSSQPQRPRYELSHPSLQSRAAPVGEGQRSNTTPIPGRVKGERAPEIISLTLCPSSR